MTAKVEKIAEQVKALPEKELDEFLSWLADYELGHADEWDKKIARDSEPGGRLQGVLDRVRKDIAEGWTRPLDEVLDSKRTGPRGRTDRCDLPGTRARLPRT